MLTTRERIQNIIDAYSPSTVVFRVAPNATVDDKLRLQAFKTKPMTKVETGDELQTVLDERIEEMWDSHSHCFRIQADAIQLFDAMKREIVRNYEKSSDKCRATQRKTMNFIYDIKMEDKHLANFILQTYISIRQDDFEDKTEVQLAAFFAPFESLRKTYGKRSR